MVRLCAIAVAAIIATASASAPHSRQSVSVSSVPRAMVFIGISNRERSIAFYRDVLGLKLVADHGQAIMFDAHGTELRLTFPPKVQVASYTVFGLAVRDIGASVASLSAKQVVFERYGFLNQTENGVMVFPNGDKVAWFKDPDGNLLSLTQFPSGKH